MKKIFKSLIIVMLFFITVTGCSSTKKHITEINLEEFKEKIANKESFALYIGNEDCTHCNSYKPVLEKVLDDYNIDIYHLNNRKLDDDELSEFKTYIGISGTPTVAFIEEGEEETALNRITGEATRDETIEKFKTNGYIK